jgi:hypothetical protein
LLARLGELKPGAVYFRAHNLLTSGDGTPALKSVSINDYTEVYDWRMDLSAKLAPRLPAHHGFPEWSRAQWRG